MERTRLVRTSIRTSGEIVRQLHEQMATSCLDEPSSPGHIGRATCRFGGSGTPAARAQPPTSVVAPSRAYFVEGRNISDVEVSVQAGAVSGASGGHGLGSPEGAQFQGCGRGGRFARLPRRGRPRRRSRSPVRCGHAAVGQASRAVYRCRPEPTGGRGTAPPRPPRNVAVVSTDCRALFTPTSSTTFWVRPRASPAPDS